MEAMIDSVVPLSAGMSPDPCFAGHNAGQACWRAYMTFNVDGKVTKSEATGWTPVWNSLDGVTQTQFSIGNSPVRADSLATKQFGFAQGALNLNALVQATFREQAYTSASEGTYNRRVGTCTGTGNATCLARVHGGSRWFSGANETAPDPTRFKQVGVLPGVDSILGNTHHTVQGPGVAIPAGANSQQCFNSALGQMGRAADVVFTWGANGFSSVRDVTHNVDVLVKRRPQASYGFLNTDANGNGFIDWDDFNYLDVMAYSADIIGNCGNNGTNGGSSPQGSYKTKIAMLENTPKVQGVSMNMATFANVRLTGQGFGLYVNGERYIFQLAGGALPGSGTSWTLRTYSGEVLAATNTATNDPGGYTFNPSTLRPALIPGLKVVFQTDSAAALIAGSEDLKKIHAVPDPYYGASLYDLAPVSEKQLIFVNVPTGATIRIYTVTGILVDILNQTTVSGGGQVAWDLRNRNNQFVGSGVYFFHVSLPDGRTHIGRFTVINSGS